MSAGEFALLAHEAIDELVSSNDMAVVAGAPGCTCVQRSSTSRFRLPVTRVPR
jgi:hypothetical protein